MEKFVIEGGYPLSGQVVISGNKNEALPAITATLLTEEPVTLRNLPDIGDVRMMLEILSDLGADVELHDNHTVSICCKNIKMQKLDEGKCSKLRASILFAGPLLARFGRATIPPPGGDVIGRRRLDTHFLALQKLGASIKANQYFDFSAEKLRGKEIFLDEPSVTATENAIMAAVLAEGTTILKNAACEPHVSGLARMLNSMGAKISGIGTNVLRIEGVEKLSGTDYTINPDYLEIGSFIALSAITNSELCISPANADDLLVIKNSFDKLGINFSLEGRNIIAPPEQSLTVMPDFAGDIPKIYDGPWPAFPSDLMSIAIVAATQAKGTILFFEKMYEGRMFFVDSLISMGARIVLCDPHRVVVVGPAQLYGARVQSPDIRAGMALILAALCAKGKSDIYNVYQIDRGYERLEEKLQKIGARVKRVNE